MTDTPNAGGEIVTYWDASAPEQGEFRRAITTGVEVIDPETDIAWFSVVRADHELTLLDPASVVNTRGRRAVASPAVLDVLASALAVLAFDLSQLDYRSTESQRNAQQQLSRFVKAITPVEKLLCTLADEDPDGPLATVLAFVDTAAEQFARGDVADGRAGILIAHATMGELVGPGPSEPS